MLTKRFIGRNQMDGTGLRYERTTYDECFITNSVKKIKEYFEGEYYA